MQKYKKSIIWINKKTGYIAKTFSGSSNTLLFHVPQPIISTTIIWNRKVDMQGIYMHTLSNFEIRRDVIRGKLRDCE